MKETLLLKNAANLWELKKYMDTYTLISTCTHTYAHIHVYAKWSITSRNYLNRRQHVTHLSPSIANVNAWAILLTKGLGSITSVSTVSGALLPLCISIPASKDPQLIHRSLELSIDISRTPAHQVQNHKCENVCGNTFCDNDNQSRRLYFGLL